MEIYILRDGKETGPYSEEETQRMLKHGEARIDDLAWKKGMPDWIPLHSVLYPAVAAEDRSASTNTEVPALSIPAEPATAKQKAFLSYMGIRYDAEISKGEAALLVNDAMENPSDPARIARWNDERLKLHPELFAAEIQARKEQRSTRFFDLSQTDGAKCVDGLTKAHCQVLVNYLDVKFPNWDANETEALWNYFLPAVREKFPQLVRKEWKDRLKFPQGPKASAAVVRRPAVVAKTNRRSPLALVIRGMAIVLILFGLAIGVIYLQQHPDERVKLRQQGEALIARFSKAAPRVVSGERPRESASTVSSTVAPAPEVGTGSPDTSPAVAPTAPATSTPSATPPAPEMAPSAATSETAATPAAPPASAAGESLFGPPSTPAPSAGEPPAMAATSEAGSLLPGPKTHVTLTQAVKIETPYGPMEFRRGMTFPLVSQEGVDVTVRFQGRIIDIPASATDLAGEAPAP